MKVLSLFILVLTTGCFGGNEVPTDEGMDDVTIINGAQKFVSDTICFEEVKRMKIYRGSILRGCQIIHNDSISSKLGAEFNRDKPLSLYNIATDSTELAHERSGDTIKVKILYLVAARNKIVPDGIHFVKDTLFFTERTDTTNSRRDISYRVEEVYLEFLIKDNSRLKLKHYWK